MKAENDKLSVGAFMLRLNGSGLLTMNAVYSMIP
jgi:hypothetical protein